MFLSQHQKKEEFISELGPSKSGQASIQAHYRRVFPGTTIRCLANNATPLEYRHNCLRRKGTKPCHCLCLSEDNNPLHKSPAKTADLQPIEAKQFNNLQIISGQMNSHLL
jgi:hypothetical protein